MPKAKKKKTPQPITKRIITKEAAPRGPALIRKFHTLQNALRSALECGDTTEQDRIEKELASLGGIDTYQKASIRGQDKRRGGDSSKVLVDWLKADAQLTFVPNDKIQVLEIGSLSTDNYISKFNKCRVSRIDLNSQHPEIQQQDFLQRPRPNSDLEQFHGISCSLVLNFVPAAQRSDFLLHLTHFLPPSDETCTRWLFFVMPAPCITNSRYMDKSLLLRIFKVLGFEVLQEKMSDRIAYWLFKRVAQVTPNQNFKKKELQKGNTRNNFFISLQT